MILSLDFISAIVDHQKLDADEIQCRAREQARITEKRAASKKPVPAEADEAADPEKTAREYCAQRRGVIASERQAAFAGLGLAVGLVALIAAIAAAVFAGMAAKATQETADQAVISAKATTDAVVQMARDIEVQISAEQPKLYVALNLREPDSDNIVRCFIRNAGRTLAMLLEYWVSCSIDYKFPDPPNYDEESSVPLNSIAISKDDTGIGFPLMVFVSPHDGLSQIEQGGTGIAGMWGYVLYEDVFGRKMRFRFGQQTSSLNTLASFLQGKRPHIYWGLAGGDIYNGTSQEPEKKDA